MPSLLRRLPWQATGACRHLCTWRNLSPTETPRRPTSQGDQRAPIPPVQSPVASVLSAPRLRSRRKNRHRRRLAGPGKRRGRWFCSSNEPRPSLDPPPSPSWLLDQEFSDRKIFQSLLPVPWIFVYTYVWSDKTRWSRSSPSWVLSDGVCTYMIGRYSNHMYKTWHRLHACSSHMRSKNYYMPVKENQCRSHACQ